jgi:hypothetical protein
MSNDKVLLLHVPNSIAKYGEHLMWFFEGMLIKLDKNSHKTTPTSKDIPAIIEDLREEVIEFEEQLALNKFDENTLIELMDAANFAFLAYVALRLQGVEHERKTKTPPLGL